MINIDAPVIRSEPQSGYVEENKSFELKCDADGNPSITYEWFRVGIHMYQIMNNNNLKFYFM